MKVLKHGNRVKEEVFVCPTCGCEFIPLPTEIYTAGDFSRYGLCPECMTRVYSEAKATHAVPQEDRIIKEVMEFIDFEKIHNVMVHLDWKWGNFSNGNSRVPSVEDLKEEAERLLREAWKKQCSIATGGFHVTYEKSEDEWSPGLGLRFEIEGCTGYIDVEDNVQIF